MAALAALTALACGGETAFLGADETPTFVDPAAPPDAPAQWQTLKRDAAAAPQVVYPLKDSTHPINLREMKVQWRRARLSQSMFRLRFRSAGGDVLQDVYAPCFALKRPEECGYDLSDVWVRLAESARGRAIALEVSGRDGSSGAIATSESIPLRFSASPIDAGLYYWSAEEVCQPDAPDAGECYRGSETSPPRGFGIIYRVPFGARKAVRFIEPPRDLLTTTPETNPNACAGCHSVSPDGRRLAFTTGAAADEGRLRIAETGDPSVALFDESPIPNSAFITLSPPNGERALVAHAGELSLRDSATGAVLQTVDRDALLSGAYGYFPEFSPDGTKVVLTLSRAPVTDWSVTDGSIAVMPFDGSRFGVAREIVATGDDFHFYPSWSPDGRFIVFASAPSGDGRSSYNQRDARLRLVASTGGPVHELERATHEFRRTSTWPKFTPIAEQGGNVFFVTFNSKIDYGFVLKNSELEIPRPQLWLTAIDVRRLGKADASDAPVWLPFQDVRQHNHLGYWTSQLICTTDADCGGSSCIDRRCVFVE